MAQVTVELALDIVQKAGDGITMAGSRGGTGTQVVVPASVRRSYPYPYPYLYLQPQPHPAAAAAAAAAARGTRLRVRRRAAMLDWAGEFDR